MQNEKPRVLLLIPHLGNGGAQKVFHDQTKYFSKFAEIYTVEFDHHPTNTTDQVDSASFDLSPTAPSLLHARNPVYRIIYRAIKLRKLVDDLRIDVVISHMDGANWINILSLSKAQKISVLHGSVLHDRGFSKFFQWFRINFIVPLFYRFGNATVAVSEGIVAELASIGLTKKIVSIPNFFDLEFLNQQASDSLTPAEQEVFKKNLVLITAGRLCHQKNHKGLLKVFSKLKNKHPSLKLVILGDGELHQSLVHFSECIGLRVFSLRDSAQEIGTDFDVYFLGQVKNPHKYFRNSKIFLFPSDYEGFPLALCEAMIAGLPVMSTDCPTGPREIIAPGTGCVHHTLAAAEFCENGVLLPLISDDDSIEIWASAISRFIAKPHLMDIASKNGLQLTMRLDHHKVICDWEALIRKACETQSFKTAG